VHGVYGDRRDCSDHAHLLRTLIGPVSLLPPPTTTTSRQLPTPTSYLSPPTSHLLSLSCLLPFPLPLPLPPTPTSHPSPLLCFSYLSIRISSILSSVRTPFAATRRTAGAAIRCPIRPQVSAVRCAMLGARYSRVMLPSAPRPQHARQATAHGPVVPAAKKKARVVDGRALRCPRTSPSLFAFF
jgi:hypothetical protein